LHGEVIVKITNLDKTVKIEVTMEGASNVKKQLPISSQDGSPTFSFRVFTVEPEGHTPYHTHAFEHVNYIVEGEGVVVMANGEERPVKKGDFVLVLPGEKHQYKNKSASSPFVMICAVPKEYE
jgi:quercetin dioxygenase-like cupin family protein